LVAAAAQPAGGIRQLAEAGEIVRLEQRDAVVEVEAFAGEHLVADRSQRVEAGGSGHAVVQSTHAGRYAGAMDAELERGLDRFAGTVLVQRPAVSLAVAVTDRERTLAVRSYGPVDAATMFQIG